MTAITIQLPDGYTADQAYQDAAIVSGWTPIVATTSMDTSVKPPTAVTTDTPNPVSAADYGRAVWERVLNERINTTRVEALRIRLAAGQGATITG